MSASRQKVLFGVLGFLLLIVAWQYLAPSGDSDSGSSQPAAVDPESAGEPAAPQKLPGARRARTKGSEDERPVELRLADLAVRPHDYKPGRDPFSFHEPPPGPSPEELAAARARAEQERLEREAAEQRAREAVILAQQPPPPPPPPQPPPFPFSYVGNIGPENHRIAAFSDGKTQILAEEGEVIQGQFIVAHIGYESVDIKFVNFPNAPAKRLAVGRR